MMFKLRKARWLNHIATYVLVLLAVCVLASIEDGGFAAKPVSSNQQASILCEHTCHIGVDRGASESPAVPDRLESSGKMEEEEDERLRKQHGNTESHHREVAVYTYCTEARQAANRAAPPIRAHFESVVLRL